MTQMIESRMPNVVRGRHAMRNVGMGERFVSALVGTLVLRRAAHHSGLSRLVGATAGSMLLARAASGHSRVYDRIGVSSAALGKGAGIDIEAGVTIDRPLPVVYAFFREPANLALVMRHVESVVHKSPGITHWVVRGPRDMTVEWDSRIINERRNDFIAWESLPGADVQNAGSVHFREAGDKGTEVLLRMRYTPAHSAARFLVAKVLNVITESEVAEDLRRLKHVMEAGVDITAEGQPHGATGATGGGVR